MVEPLRGAMGELESKALDLARSIDAPDGYLPTFGASDDTGRPSIEHRGDELAYVVRERGEVFEERSPSSQDELLYWIFGSVTQHMATDWELRHRVANQDSRRGWIPRQLELLRSLSPAWEDRWRREHAELLETLGIPTPPRDIR
jgi:hypothetical protein